MLTRRQSHSHTKRFTAKHMATSLAPPPAHSSWVNCLAPSQLQNWKRWRPLQTPTPPPAARTAPAPLCALKAGDQLCQRLHRRLHGIGPGTVSLARTRCACCHPSAPSGPPSCPVHASQASCCCLTAPPAQLPWIVRFGRTAAYPCCCWRAAAFAWGQTATQEMSGQWSHSGPRAPHS